MSRTSSLLLITMLILLAVALPCHAASWNFPADFSTASNPSGYWSYGFSYDGGLNTDLYMNSYALTPTYPDVKYWAYTIAASRDWYGAVHKNTGASATNVWDLVYWEAGQGGMVPEGAPNPDVVVRWTSPITGYVSINARFTGQHPPGTKARVRVYKDTWVERTLLLDREVRGFIGTAANGYTDGNGTTREQVYSTTIAVSSGNFIDFVDTRIGTDQFDGAVALDATITEVANPPGVIHGQVKASVAGNPPVQGARVSVVGGTANVMTEADGSYSLSLPPGSYTLEASYPGVSSVTSPSITLAALDDKVQDFTLGMAKVTGVVKSPAAGNPPVEGATVRVVGGPATSTTGADGIYSLLLPSGSQVIEASHPDYTNKTESLDLALDETRSFDILLPPRTSWDFAADFSKVSNPNTAGAWSYGFTTPGVPFTLYAGIHELPGYANDWFWARDTSGSRGEAGFVNKNFFETGYSTWSLAYWEPGMAGIVPDFPTGGDAVVRWTSPIDGYVTLYARMTGQHDAGTEATVRFVKETGGVRTELYACEVLGFNGSSWQGYVDRQGIAPEVFYSTTIPVAVGDIIDVVDTYIGSFKQYLGAIGLDLKINTASEPGTISGFVRASASGNPPVSGAKVKVVGMDMAVTTGSDGSYSLALPAGTYTLEASYPGVASTTSGAIALAAGETKTQDLVLNMSRVMGVIRASASGNPPVSGAVVGILGGRSMTTGADGAYSFLVAPGTYTVTASHQEYIGARATLSVAVGQTLVQDLVLSPRTGWDFVQDMSFTVNPNGAWSYGWSPDNDPANFRLYANSYKYGGDVIPPVVGLWLWAYTSYASKDWQGTILQNLTGAPYEHYSLAYWEIGQVCLVGNNAGSPWIIARWTAPAAGGVSVNARFTAQTCAVSAGYTTDANVRIAHNGVPLLEGPLSGFIGRAVNNYADAIPGPVEQVYSSASPIVMAAGDTIDFMIARIGSNNWGATVGLEVNITPPAEPAGLAEIKANPENSPVVTVPLAVTAKFGDTFYIEEDDRSVGIRVDLPGNTVSVGQKVAVSGTLKVDQATGEVYIEATGASDSGMGSIEPVGMTNKALGGGNDGLQQGVQGGSGLNNIGLLVRTTGKVSQPSPGVFSIDDGSGVGVRVTDISLSAYVGTNVVVEGANSCYKDGSAIKRLVRAISVRPM
ncbi:MAG: carboxypeptidase regulatory-like domain-containing protein [Armatimonadetes bacterium]|nr:carboxypeptidase regulatory-like domain-containing protein [Armatimonadota bacterium]